MVACLTRLRLDFKFQNEAIHISPRKLGCLAENWVPVPPDLSLNSHWSRSPLSRVGIDGENKLSADTAARYLWDS